VGGLGDREGNWPSCGEELSGRGCAPGRHYMRILLKIAKVLLVLVGLVAALHVVCLLCKHPLVRLVEVDGISMQPTFEPGDRLLCVRRHFQPGSIVIADAGEDGSVVKRVVRLTNERVHLIGDNREQSAEYDLPRTAVVGVYLLQLPLKLPCCKAR